MEEGSFILVILLVGILAAASFARGGFGDFASGPKTDPPNPKAEFGVVHEKRSFFSSSPTPPPKSQPPPPPTSGTHPPSTEEDLEVVLQKYVRVSARSARSNNPDKEYIDISYSSGSSKDAPELLNLSGWTLSNVRGGSFVIGTATNLPGVSSIQNQDQLLLRKGGTIHIITGRSPLGINFRLNKCAEYFEQFHSFTPGISTSCPAPSKEPGKKPSPTNVINSSAD